MALSPCVALRERGREVGPSSLDNAWILLIFKAISLPYMQINANGAQAEKW